MDWISFKDQIPTQVNQEFLLYDEGKIRIAWLESDLNFVVVCGCDRKSECCEPSKELSDDACWMFLPEKPK